jgi:regulator of protease activity HflC (stomatin/prohibitin superfamily)
MTWLFVAIFIAYLLWSVFKILKEYERGVIFRLGRLVGTRGPGLIILIPGIEKMVKVSLRLVTLDVPPQDIITKDNVSVKVNAVVYFRVMNPDNAIVEVEDFLYATSQLAQTTMRSVCGEAELDDLLAEREKLNFKLQEILDKQTDPWGIKVTNVEIKHIELSDEMKRAMAKQAEAERERRAKVIHATGEFQAATKLSEAAEIMSNPVSLQLRYLQTLTEVAVEKNSTLVFPLPIDLLKPFMEVKKKLEQGD